MRPDHLLYLAVLLLIFVFAIASGDPVAVSASPSAWAQVDEEFTSARAIAPPDTLPPVPPLPNSWTLLRCRQNVVRRTVPTAGGEVARGAGIVRLRVPRNALARSAEVVVEESDSTLEAGITVNGGNVTFRRPVGLTMSFASCPADVPAAGQTLAILRYRPSDGWQVLGGRVSARTIQVDITELSRFAIATRD